MRATPRIPSVQFLSTPCGKLFQIKRELRGKRHVPERRFAEVLVSVVGKDGKGRMVRALLDSGCSKSLILKEFTRRDERTELEREKRITYQTHGGDFVSSSTASVAFRLVEFENNHNITIEHEFQVDEKHKSKRSKYDMIIGSDLLWQMGVDISYSKERVE